MGTYKKPTDYFDVELAELLADKITVIDSGFDAVGFVQAVESNYKGKALKERVELMADQLHLHLPYRYVESVELLLNILGPENDKETGMFTEFYWVMPIAKFVEKFGLDHFSVSMRAIEEITMRNTGEYAIRPFIRKYPKETLQQMYRCAQAQNFHLRRLASEGLRPKLPWAPKLELFIDHPGPVFEILYLLKEEPVHFVRKSVANHITDYLKVNPVTARELIADWEESDNENTRWILKYATRKQK